MSGRLNSGKMRSARKWWNTYIIYESSPSQLVSEPDPQKIKKEGLVHLLGWKFTPPSMQAHFRLAFDWHSDVRFLEMLTTQEPSKAFCFILESCNHQAGKIECLHVWLCKVHSTINKIHSVHFHPAPFIRPSFYIFSLKEWPFRLKYEHSSFIIQYWYVLWCIYNTAILFV